MYQRDRALRIGRVEHHVRERHRDRLERLDLARLSLLDVARHLERPPVPVEAPEPVAAAVRRQLARLGDQLHSRGAELGGEPIDRCLVGRADTDQVDPFVVALTEPDDERLGRSLGGEVGEVAVLGDLGESPQVEVEVALGPEVGHGQVDVAEVGDESFGHGILVRVVVGSVLAVDRVTRARRARRASASSGPGCWRRGRRRSSTGRSAPTPRRRSSPGRSGGP